MRLLSADAKSGATKDDALMQSRSLRALISGAHGVGAGSVVDLAPGSWDKDALERLRVVVSVAGRPVALRTQRVSLDDTGAAPAVSVEHTAAQPQLRVLTRYMLSPNAAALEIVSTVDSRQALSDVRVGDQVRWFGAPAFVPGVGHVERSERAEAKWAAFVGRSAAYSIVSRSMLELKAEGRAGGRQQSAWSPPMQLGPKRSGVFERQVLTTDGSLHAASHAAWKALGLPLGRLSVTLVGAPAWAVIEVHSVFGGIVSAGPPNPGAPLSLDLPADDYRVVLRSPGGRDEVRTRVRPGARVDAKLIAPTASKLTFATLDKSGSAVPARLSVRGISPTPDPDLGPPHYAGGAKTSVYSADGTGEVSLPPGRYRVLASHGPEYSIAEPEVAVNEKDGAVIRVELERVAQLDSYVSCDFHLHAEPSGDSDVPLPDRVVSLLAEDVRFAVATDHNRVTDYGPALRSLGREAELSTEIGVELTTSSWGHFNAFPYPAGQALPDVNQLPTELFSAVRSAAPAALIQINHPRMHEIGYFNQGQLDVETGEAKTPGYSWDFDSIEVFNGFDLGALGQVEENLRQWLQLLKRGYRFTAVGNSDSHRLDRELAGYPRTYVRLSPDTTGSMSLRVATALRAGRAFVTNGPLVELTVAAAAVGDTHATTEAEVPVSVRIQAASWVAMQYVQIWVDGAPLQRVDVPAPAAPGKPRVLNLSVPVPLGKSSVVAVVRGTEPLPVLNGLKAPAFAFTNPVYVQRD
ncbi:MAG TPA: CehA/McbA family metallohydrolase [Polyangiaceae bacterium]|nr:CehA/McbA family metallohydrolase [Polyangiaceae bacterium]